MIVHSNGNGLILEPARNRRAAIGAGVIGLGRSGVFFHCRPIEDAGAFHLVGVHDALPDVSAKVASKYECRNFKDHRDLISCPDIDLVIVAVPTNAHFDIALDAIAAGKNVLIEKPFARSSAEAEEIFAAGKRAGVFVGAFHNRRFDPDVRALKEVLDSGVLGPVLKVSIHLHAYTRRKDWQTRREMGGGALSNWGAHALDWCFHLFGRDLTFLHGRLLQVLNPGDAEDSFILTLETGETAIEIEYLNFVAKPLPKWHVVGKYGTAISEGKTFQVRYCDPSLLGSLKVDPGCASDGTYGINEDLCWTESEVPWGHWDNCPLYLDSLYKHLTESAPVPVPPEEVLAELRLMEKIRAMPVRSFGRREIKP